MPPPKPQLDDIQRALVRYDNNERPWRQSLNRVDWFIAYDDQLYPLKYTYALATNIPPAEYTTNQMKAAMSHLQIPYVSLKSQKEIDDKFAADVHKARTNRDGRKARLESANPNPRLTYTINGSFQRNPDVVAEVLDRANGKCECCNSPAPFVRAADGTPYLEVHHIDFLADGGEDTVANAEALCPNCHRQKHYGRIAG